jgi:DedD protein
MMERRVKERLIGATLLVVLIVLVVPEMLSGPRQPSAPPLTVGLPVPTRTTRSVSVDLTTSKAIAEPDLSDGASAAPQAPASAASPGAAADRTSGAANAPGGGSEGASDAAPTAPTEQSTAESPPTVTNKAQEPSGSTLETPASPPKSAAGGSGAGAAQQGRRGWAVQLGSFVSRANADRLVHQLQARGGSSLYVSASGSGPSLRYRVRVGPLTDRGAAERAAGKLRAAGHPATVVTPAS